MAQPSVRDGASPPSIRQQLRFVLALYQSLTNIYFLLIEHRASTSSASVRATLTTQITRLRDQLTGRDGPSIATRRDNERRRDDHVQTRGSASSSSGTAMRIHEGLANVRSEHADRIASLSVIQAIAEGSTETVALPALTDVAEAIYGLDAILSELMARSRRHAVNQARIQRLVSQIESRDESMVSAIRRLAVLRDRCERLVRLGRQEEEAIKRAEQRPLAYEDILRYGRTLSQTTTAPPGFTLPAPPDDDGAVDGNERTSTKPLYQTNGDGGGQANGELRAGVIPPHLQDKLPFPSVDAIRRGASEVRPPTWAMFQRGVLQQPALSNEGGAEEQGQQGEEEDVDMREAREQQQRQKRAQAAAQQQQQQQRQKPAAAPVEQEEDGFGLDLN